MHGKDTTTMQPGDLVHFVYRIPDTGAQPGERKPRTRDPEYVERVVRVTEMRPDGLGFRGDCLRRAAEGETHFTRTFLFERMRAAQEWDRQAIRTMGGLTVVPAFSRVIDKIRETNPQQADRLQAQADRAVTR